MTDSKPGSRVELVDAYGRPIGAGIGSGSGSGSYGADGLPFGTKPGSYSQQNGGTGPGGSSPGSYGNGNGANGPGSSYSNGRQNGKILWKWNLKVVKHLTMLTFDF